MIYSLCIVQYPCISVLDLSNNKYNKIGDEGLSKILNALTLCHNLKYLDLSNNMFENALSKRLRKRIHMLTKFISQITL